MAPHEDAAPHESAVAARMTGSLRRRAAAAMMLGFQGQEPSEALSRFVRETPPAGVIVFQRNIRSTAQAAQLTRDLRALWPADAPAPWIALDQEGGRVRRLKAPQCPEVSALPDARVWGLLGDVEATRLAGEVTGRQLAALGFNLDFAPVLDVDSNPANPVIGPRSFGATPDAVIRHALAWAEGLRAGGVVGCGKHFPGHGDTDLDSHLALPRLAHDLERLRRVELAPFRAAIERHVCEAMMSAHIVFEALDPQWPATLSPRVIPTLLRDELGFDGVLFSDDLEMQAIAAHQSPDTIARRGLEATLDVFLVCHEVSHATAIRDAIARAAGESSTHAAALAAANRRVQALREVTPDHARTPWAGGVPMQREGQALVDRVAAADGRLSS